MQGSQSGLSTNDIAGGANTATAQGYANNEGGGANLQLIVAFFRRNFSVNDSGGGARTVVAQGAFSTVQQSLTNTGRRIEPNAALCTNKMVNSANIATVSGSANANNVGRGTSLATIPGSFSPNNGGGGVHTDSDRRKGFYYSPTGAC